MLPVEDSRQYQKSFGYDYFEARLNIICRIFILHSMHPFSNATNAASVRKSKRFGRAPPTLMMCAQHSILEMAFGRAFACGFPTPSIIVKTGLLFLAF
jgi:hypothetical protein